MVLRNLPDRSRVVSGAAAVTLTVGSVLDAGILRPEDWTSHGERPARMISDVKDPLRGAH
jgi:hypothetical protein